MENGSVFGEDSDNDMDEDASASANSAEADDPSTPSQQNGAGSTWKAPTTEELANIKAASELFKSNAFKLKVHRSLLIMFYIH